MKKKNSLKKIIFLLIFSIISYYFFQLNNDKSAIIVNDLNKENSLNQKTLGKQITKFSNVEYQSLNSNKKNYILKGNEAYIEQTSPDIINIIGANGLVNSKNMNSINILSDTAIYDKRKKNIFFKGNIKIYNNEYQILANNAYYFDDKNLMELEGGVVIKKPLNIIKSDFVKINTLTNDIEMGMKSKNMKVYGQSRK